MADDIKETPSLPQQQEQERSISVDSKQSSEIVFSTPIQEHSENTATSYCVPKKVTFSCDNDQLQTDNNITEAKKELSFSCFVSGVKENQEKFDSASEMITTCDSVSGVLKCDRKVKAFGLQVEETESYEAVCVGNVEESLNDVEKALLCGLVSKERKDFLKVEVGSSGTQECDKFKEEKDSIVEGDSQENMRTSSVDVGKEMKSETLLEAEKKRLLAELELGTAFEDKTHVDKVTGIRSDCEEVQNDGETIDGIKLIDGSVRRSVKIEVIDDTALIESVQVPKTGNGCLKGVEIAGTAKMMKRNGKEEKKQEVDGNKEKRPRRKTKGAKEKENFMGVSARLKNLTHIAEDQVGGLNNGGGVKIVYSRKEMEALRFVNIVVQQKMWRDVYTGLGPVVVNEYDNLASLKHHKQNMCFPRKSEAPGILGQECSENMENEAGFTRDYEADNLNTMNTAYCSHSIEEGEAYTVPEGECSEDYDSDKDYASIQKPAFLVEGEPNFDSGPPEDGLEYLRRVRWEAAHIPKVKVAKPGRQKCKKEQTGYMPQIPDIAKCPEHLLPLKKWEDLFLADFSELRLAVSGLGNASAPFSGELQQVQVINKSSENIIVEMFNNLNPDKDHSYHPLDAISLKGSTDQPSLPSNEDDEISLADQSHKTCAGEDSGDSPTLSAILRMDFVARVSMLRKRISSVETLSTLSRNDCLWLFALCAAVDTPLDADTCAAVRSLLRKCASLRAGKSELDDEVIMLNILATISGKYFGQSER